jgi:fucose permease
MPERCPLSKGSILIQAAPQTRRTDYTMVVLAYTGFIILAIPSAMLGIAWLQMRETFGVPLDALGLLLIPSTIGYSTASALVGRVITRYGVGTTLLICSALSIIGLLGYAVAPVWPVLLLAAFIAGLGGGMLDSGMNIYFAANYSPRLMNWLHACFGVGATLGSAFITTVLNNGQTWRTAYALTAVMFVVLGAIFFFTRDRWETPVSQEAHADGATGIRIGGLAIWLGVALFFVYGGVEVTPNNWGAALFTARHVPEADAGYWVSFYWASFTIGRFLFGVIVNRIRVRTSLQLCMIGIIIGAALVWWNPTNTVGLVGLAVMGFAMAPVFPLLMTDTQERLGPQLAPHAIGLQVAGASLGIAILPGLAGLLANRVSIETLGPFLLLLALAVFALYQANSPRRAQ